MEQAIPFGAHKGRPLSDVPGSYLTWLARTCKLSTGLRAAVGAELARRGVAAPPPPAPKPEPVCCPGAGLNYEWAEDRLGRRQVRRTCRRCNRPLGYAPRVPPFTDWADRAAGAAPILEVLIRCEEMGLRLRNDGAAVDFATPADWHRAPPELRRRLHECRHPLAAMLPRGRGTMGQQEVQA
jgi:hypothetical protein